jgi:carboxypeptidase C (cathepsin A)
MVKWVGKSQISRVFWAKVMRSMILTTFRGPGASSMVGLFEEIGPCEFTEGTNTTLNPHSWVKFANLLFLEYGIPFYHSALRDQVTKLQVQGIF